MKEEILNECQAILGYQFNNIEHLQKALTHPSLARDRSKSYERLEFLGDSVLGLSVCSMLFRDFKQMQEGEMTQIKSTVVSRKMCATIGRDIGLDKLLFIGPDLSCNSGIPDSVVAATFESIIGAMFVDGGYRVADEFVVSHLSAAVENTLQNLDHQNCKSLLQQHAQSQNMPNPEYILLDEKGPDHNKCFEVAVSMGNNHFSSAWGMTKKDAEQEAARRAMEELGILDQQ